jgi:hypothetical protein
MKRLLPALVVLASLMVTPVAAQDFDKGLAAAKRGDYVTFQLAEVAVSKSLFQKILALIDDLRRSPVPA